MFLIYECGTCGSAYKLDTDKVTLSGVKITCPKCLSFIILKSDIRNEPYPTIEKLAGKDGAYEINAPSTMPKIDVDIELPPALSEKGTDPKLPFLQEEILALSDSQEVEIVEDPNLLSAESFDEVLKQSDYQKNMPDEESEPPVLNMPNPQGKSATQQHVDTGKIHNDKNILTSADLLSYPETRPPEGKFDSLLIPLSLIAIVISALLFLNYRGFILIPGLEKLRVEHLNPTPEPTIAPTVIVTPKANFGFPVIEDTPSEEEQPPNPSSSPQ